MEDRSMIRQQAEEIAEEIPYVKSEVPLLPEITGDPLKDASAQFDITHEEINNIAGLLEISEGELCHSFTKIAENLGGGISPEGKRKWLVTRLGDLSLEEMVAQADKYKDSPVT